jgi:hypothetical protein
MVSRLRAQSFLMDLQSGTETNISNLRSAASIRAEETLQPSVASSRKEDPSLNNRTTFNTYRDFSSDVANTTRSIACLRSGAWILAVEPTFDLPRRLDIVLVSFLVKIHLDPPKQIEISSGFTVVP